MGGPGLMLGFQRQFDICKGSEIIKAYHLKHMLMEYQRILHKRERTATYAP